MTSGDEAGALTDSEVRTDPGTDSRDAPAPAEPDPAEPDPAGADDDAVEDSAGDDDGGADGLAGEPSGGGRWAVTVAVLVVALIAGLVTTGIFWSRASGASASGDGEQAAEAAARTGVTDLLTADYRDPGAWSAKLKPLAAGQFLSVIGNSSSGFGQILAQGKVQTTGQVQDIGVEKFTGTTGQFAVIAYETVKNTQTPKGSQRAYRMVVSMVQSGSKWLVSNVEFVQ